MSYKWSEDDQDRFCDRSPNSRALQLERLSDKGVVLEVGGLIAFAGGWTLFSPELTRVFDSADMLNIEISGLCWTYSIATGSGVRPQQIYTGHTKHLKKRLQRHADALPMDKSKGWQCWITLHMSEELAIANEIDTIKYSVREGKCHVLNIQHASNMMWEVGA